MILDSKIADILISQLSIEELEAIIERKKQIVKPKVISDVEHIKNYCRELLLKKLYPPKFR